MIEDKKRRLELEEGDVVQYTDKRSAAVVKVVEVEEDDSYIGYDAEVLDEIFGDFRKDTITFGCTKDKSMHHYVSWKVKEPWSLPQYVMSDSLDELREELSEIEDKYKENYTAPWSNW